MFVPAGERASATHTAFRGKPRGGLLQAGEVDTSVRSAAEAARTIA